MDLINISAIQSNLIWQSPDENFRNFENLLTLCSPNTDVIVLPEMFTTGFSMDSEICAETMDGPSVNWMKSTSAKLDAAVVGSLIIKDADQYFNRLVWMMPDGSFQHYDKKHLFAMAGEDEHYSRGKEKLLVEYKGWSFCPQICYDLRFPEWGRNSENYDVLIYVANWPETRAYHWSTLLKARAIENQSYVIGVNRVGKDHNGLNYSGDSAVYDYNGKSISDEVNNENVINVTLNKENLDDFRRKLPFLKDQDIK